MYAPALLSCDVNKRDNTNTTNTITLHYLLSHAKTSLFCLSEATF